MWPKLISLLNKIFKQLQQVEPLPNEYDVVWEGPYFIPQKKKWSPSQFLYYNGILYCSLFIDWGTYRMDWKIKDKKINFETGSGSGGDYYNNEYLWERALTQIYQRLKSALKNPERYNRHVKQYLPFACQEGKIERRYTWDRKTKSIIPFSKIQHLEDLLAEAAKLEYLSQMTLRKYLETVAITKNAVFKGLKSLSLVEKYKKRADTRHGGLLDLPMDDAEAFKNWYCSGRWAGSHPWEIVYGHPHGIMLAPHHDEKGWKYILWVDSLGWYDSAAYMAIALGEKKIFFEFRDSQEIISALKGADLVEVGPFFRMVSYEELKRERPEVIKYIQWKPLSQFKLITPNQKERLQSMLKGVL